MRKIIKAAYAAAIVMTMTACYDESVQVENAEVRFDIDMPISISAEPMSRATPTEAGVQYIYVYDGSTLISTQVSTDENFGNPTISLTYGSHELTFIASVQAYPTEGKVKDTFGYNYTLNVSSSTAQQNISLSRIVTKLQVLMDDAIPSNADHVTISFDRYDTVDLSTLCGNRSISSPARLNISSAVGQIGIIVSTMTFCESITDEWTDDVTVTFYTSSDVVIQQQTISDVPLKANRTTQLKGNWFGGSNSPTLSINNTWEDTEIVNI